MPEQIKPFSEEVADYLLIRTNQTPIDYLNKFKTDPEYQNEQGLTPEDYITYAISQLEEKNKVIDDYQGNGKACHMTGAYFQTSGYVPCGRWYRGSRQALLARAGSDDRISNSGARSGVSVG